jgi:N4-(beta-N-acetylglucosaminyl)-L-asparaginase
MRGGSGGGPCSRVVGTWSFSAVGVRACARSIVAGESALDAVVAGVRAVELDPSVTSVGYGGLPTAEGALELDAAVMTGDGSVGAVAAMPCCRAAAPVARAVLMDSRHTLLAGGGAAAFAAARGLAADSVGDLLTPHARKRLAEHLSGADLPNAPSGEDGLHTDTVGMICLDASGALAACCATSGMEFKDGGRVGDAPLVGSGLFADGDVGAAVASGEGDKMIRFCMAFLVVEELRRGATVQDACETAVRRVRDADSGCQAAICAIDARTGAVGAACTRDGFKVVEWDSGDPVDEPRLVAVPGLPPRKLWRHTCV